MQTGQIFFSYSRNDGKFALKLGEDLRKAGVDIWIDQIDIPPSEPWDEEIEKALTQSDCLLVILSHTSVASDNVLNEINYALESKKQVLPILLENNIKKPFNIGRLQHIDFTGSYEKGFDLLLKALSLSKPLPVTHKTPYRRIALISIITAIILIIAVLLKISLLKPDNQDTSGQKGESTRENAFVNVSGNWSSDELTNPFDDHDKYKLSFDFELVGNSLVGSLKIISAERGSKYAITKGIADGKLIGNTISFHTLEEAFRGSETVAYKNFYLGSIQKEDEIKFSLQSDRPWGFPGQKFMARRTAPIEAGH